MEAICLNDTLFWSLYLFFSFFFSCSFLFGGSRCSGGKGTQFLNNVFLLPCCFRVVAVESWNFRVFYARIDTSPVEGKQERRKKWEGIKKENGNSSIMIFSAIFSLSLTPIYHSNLHILVFVVFINFPSSLFYLLSLFLHTPMNQDTRNESNLTAKPQSCLVQDNSSSLSSITLFLCRSRSLSDIVLRD